MSINYLDIIGSMFPGIEVYSTGDPSNYEAIVWSDPLNIIPKEDLDTACLAKTKEEVIKYLSDECEKAIIGGFESNALGSPYIYDSEQVDQINLLGAVSATVPTEEAPNGHSMYYACRDPITHIKDYQLHTHEQIKYVMITGAQFKLSKLQHFHALRTLVNAQTDHTTVRLITWDTDPGSFTGQV